MEAKKGQYILASYIYGTSARNTLIGQIVSIKEGHWDTSPPGWGGAPCWSYGSVYTVKVIANKNDNSRYHKAIWRLTSKTEDINQSEVCKVFRNEKDAFRARDEYIKSSFV